MLENPENGKNQKKIVQMGVVGTQIVQGSELNLKIPIFKRSAGKYRYYDRKSVPENQIRLFSRLGHLGTQIIQECELNRLIPIFKEFARKYRSYGRKIGKC